LSHFVMAELGAFVVTGGLLLVIVVSALWSLITVFRVICGRVSLLSGKTLVPIVCLAVSVAVLLLFLPDQVANKVNPVLENQQQYLSPPSREAVHLHQQLWVADLHADSLLWPTRNLNTRTAGHVDVPKLLQGNVALQAFTIVTSSPLLMNFERNPKPHLYDDTITIKAVCEAWGINSITSLSARTMFQVQQFYKMVEQSEGRVFPIRTKADLNRYVDIRKTNNITAGFLGIEGLHALDGDIYNIDKFYDAGIRMMAPVHFFDNDLGGSAHGVEKNGLTEFGKKVVKRLSEKKILIDVSHASEKLIDDVLSVATSPVMVSHTGIRGVCESPRNLRDHHLKAIAATGGVIGVAYFSPAQCGDNLLESIIKSIQYLKNLVGVEAIGLGSDYDGGVAVPFDTTGLIHITNGLLEAGFQNSEIELIMGKNALRLLNQTLPEK